MCGVGEAFVLARANPWRQSRLQDFSPTGKVILCDPLRELQYMLIESAIGMQDFTDWFEPRDIAIVRKSHANTCGGTSTEGHDDAMSALEAVPERVGNFVMKEPIQRCVDGDLGDGFDHAGDYSDFGAGRNLKLFCPGCGTRSALPSEALFQGGNSLRPAVPLKYALGDFLWLLQQGQIDCESRALAGVTFDRDAPMVFVDDHLDDR